MGFGVGCIGIGVGCVGSGVYGAAELLARGRDVAGLVLRHGERVPQVRVARLQAAVTPSLCSAFQLSAFGVSTFGVRFAAGARCAARGCVWVSFRFNTRAQGRKRGTLRSRRG